MRVVVLNRVCLLLLCRVLAKDEQVVATIAMVYNTALVYAFTTARFVVAKLLLATHTAPLLFSNFANDAALRHDLSTLFGEL